MKEGRTLLAILAATMISGGDARYERALIIPPEKPIVEEQNENCFYIEGKVVGAEYQPADPHHDKYFFTLETTNQEVVFGCWGGAATLFDSQINLGYHVKIKFDKSMDERCGFRLEEPGKSYYSIGIMHLAEVNGKAVELH